MRAMKIEAISLVAERVARHTFVLDAPTEAQAYRMQVRQHNRRDGGAAAVLICTPKGESVEAIGDCTGLRPDRRYVYELEQNGSCVRTGVVTVIPQVVKVGSSPN
jgi:hypothetical protein